MAQKRDEILLGKIVKRLKDLRLGMNLTQEKVYHDTDIHIARIETGKINISISTLSALCEYYKISLSKFFEGIDH